MTVLASTIVATAFVACSGFRVQPKTQAVRATAFKLNDAPLERITGKSSMDVGILDRYMNLEQHAKVQAEYVWLVYLFIEIITVCNYLFTII